MLPLSVLFADVAPLPSNQAVSYSVLQFIIMWLTLFSMFFILELSIVLVLRFTPRRFLRFSRPVCPQDWIPVSTCPLLSVPRDAGRLEPADLASEEEIDVV